MVVAPGRGGGLTGGAARALGGGSAAEPDFAALPKLDLPQPGAPGGSGLTPGKVMADARALGTGAAPAVTDFRQQVGAFPGFADLRATDQEHNLLAQQMQQFQQGGGNFQPPMLMQGGGQFHWVPGGQFPAYPSQAAAMARWQQIQDWLRAQLGGRTPFPAYSQGLQGVPNLS